MSELYTSPSASVRTIISALLLFCFLTLPSGVGQAREDGLSRDAITAHLGHMRRSQRGMMNIAAAEGAYLEDMINVFHTDMEGITEYRRLIDNHPQLETRYVREGSAGISISKKK